jgi:hypothetical protein
MRAGPQQPYQTILQQQQLLQTWYQIMEAWRDSWRSANINTDTYLAMKVRYVPFPTMNPGLTACCSQAPTRRQPEDTSRQDHYL